MRSGIILAMLSLTAAGCSLGLVEPCRGDESADIQQLVSGAERLQAAGRSSEAEQSLRRAVELSVAKFGSFHPATAGINRKLADFFIGQNRDIDAERCLQKALVITSGYSPAAALDGEFRGVTIFASNALRNPDSLPGSFELADVLEGYAGLYAHQGRHADSERLLKTVVRIYQDGADRRASFGSFLRPDSHELLSSAMVQLATAQSRQSKVVEAEQTLTKAITISKTRSGSDVPALLRRLGEFYRTQGRGSDAEAVEAEAASFGH